MKKLIISMLIVAAGLSVSAQKYGVKPVEQKVERAVARATRFPVWETQLKRLQTQWTLMRNNVRHYDPVPVMIYTPLSHRDEPIYLERMTQVQQSVNVNRALKEFRFVAPVPVDLAHLSLDNYALLHAFLKGLEFAKIEMNQVQPFTLALKLNGVPRGALEIWIDIPTKRIYLMSDNLYTTAAGKYGLHLK